ETVTSLPVEFVAAPPEHHFTELILEQPEKLPTGRTVGKIKDHLTSIYRKFLRDGRLQLTFKGELLQYKEPAVLIAPHPRNPDGQKLTWRKELALPLPGNKRVRGFIAVREEGSVAESGL